MKKLLRLTFVAVFMMSMADVKTSKNNGQDCNDFAIQIYDAALQVGGTNENAYDLSQAGYDRCVSNGGNAGDSIVNL